jgi:hypothetical protein
MYYQNPNTTAADLLADGFTAYEPITQFIYDTWENEEPGIPWVCLGHEAPYPAIYGRTEVTEGLGESYPITGYDRDVDPLTLTMPSLARQWRQDWQTRTARARRRGVEINAPRLRAPQSFIDTGIWPKEDS